MFKLPQWLRRDGLTLPPWARVAESVSSRAGMVSICIEVDTDAAYRAWLDELGAAHRVDQYWLEVAHQCVKLDLQSALLNTPYDPRVSAKPAEFHLTRAPQWEQKKYQKGRGADAATRGREAREHYRRIRGQLPM